jgi:hypothetical protein
MVHRVTTGNGQEVKYTIPARQSFSNIKLIVRMKKAA